MRKVNYKGRCTKRKLPKCKDVCMTFDDIQLKAAEMLQANDDIIVSVSSDGLLSAVQWNPASVRMIKNP